MSYESEGEIFESREYVYYEWNDRMSKKSRKLRRRREGLHRKGFKKRPVSSVPNYSFQLDESKRERNSERGDWGRDGGKKEAQRQ